RPDTRPRMRKRRAAVAGATGVAGQQFLAALAGHPWFEVAVLAASARSAGRPYGEAIREANGARRWWVAGTEPAPEFLALPVVDAAHLDPGGLDLVFAAVESDAARELEPMYARAVPVISTAAAFRYETDTPIALPGVNVALHPEGGGEGRRRDTEDPGPPRRGRHRATPRARGGHLHAGRRARRAYAVGDGRDRAAVRSRGRGRRDACLPRRLRRPRAAERP